MTAEKNIIGEASVLRRIAEEKTAQLPKKLKTLSPAEMRQTLHELQVHQIELEMQNEELMRVQVELENLRARYYDLYEFAPVGYCTISEKGLILEANITAATLLGVPRGALTRQPISRFIVKEDQDIYYLRRKKIFEAMETQTYEMRMLKADGTAFWAQLEMTAAMEPSAGSTHPTSSGIPSSSTQAVPGQTADGVPVCRIIVSDITARKNAEEILYRDKKALEKLVEDRAGELIKVQAELERAKRLSDIGAFAATVAHELRNPLFGISLASIIVKQKTKDSAIKHQLQIIDNMVAESEQIIDNLLLYTRLKPPHRKTFKVHSILEECVDTVRHLLADKKIVISKHFDSLKDVPISADPVQIREVFINILNNAVDAVPEHGGEISINARVFRELIKVDITDNGSGIAEENLKRVFDPFFTTKLKGTGLGLTVCMQFVKMHGGLLSIKCSKGKGTKVSVTLPKKRK